MSSTSDTTNVAQRWHWSVKEALFFLEISLPIRAGPLYIDDDYSIDKP